MAVGFGNLSGYVQALINGNYPDIGQIHYVVDPDFRTAAQGWSRPDETGPLDLWKARAEAAGSQYVYYGSGTGSPITAFDTDRNAIQAAIDAMIDFRGDTLFFTPGAYSIATTALAMDVANARYLGPPVRNPKRAAVTITDAIGTNAISVDDCEMAFLRLVPLTATSMFSLASGADGGYIHDCFYDSEGVAADTGTEFVTSTTNNDWLYENIDHFVDAAQGDCYTLVAALRHRWQNCRFLVNGATYASVVTFVTTASAGCHMDLCHFDAEAGSSLYTNLITGMAGANMFKMTRCYVHGTALATASDIETGFDATTGIEIAENYQTGDATGEGGVVIALA